MKNMNFLLSACLIITAANALGETIWLKKHSSIRNPLGLWAMALDSTRNWSETSVTIQEKNSSISAYLSNNYSPSDITPPFTSDEYQAKQVDNSDRFVLKRRNSTIAYFDYSVKTRKVNGTDTATACGVYDTATQALWAYCKGNGGGIAFDLLDLQGTKLANFYRANDRWELNINVPGSSQVNRTVALMLAGLKIF